MKAYSQLEERFRQMNLIAEAAGFLHWDYAVMMPPGGAESRAEQVAALKVLRHGIMADRATADLLDAAEQEAQKLDDWQRANLREMRREWIHATAVDADLLQAQTRAATACEMAWREARPKSDFATVLPHLSEVLRLTVEIGEARAEKLGTDVYDALLDAYEPGGRAADIDPVFDDLAAFLPGFIDEVIESQSKGPDVIEPEGPFPVDKQRELVVRVMQILGFDFNAGRLDVTLHPFSGGTPDDLRVTTRFEEDDFIPALMAVIHETGHALYDHQLPRAWRHQPVGDARGMVLHESQSLLMEMQACRTREFLGFVAPMMREVFGGDPAAWAPENLHRAYTRVKRSLIRVDADEVTYPAHVILRYRLERAMIAGQLQPSELPGAWKDELRSLLGVTPPDDRLGCLQDIHWYDGLWGYFPTYTLGAIAAAQIFEAAGRAIPDLLDRIGEGDFAPLMKWLGENIHGRASFHSTQDLLEEATGSRLNPDVFKTHLRARYLPQRRPS